MAGRKYAPLTDRLVAAARDGEPSLTLSFGEIDRLVGGLPPSARRSPNWWANSSHSQAIAVRDAGFHVGKLELDHQRVRFDRGEVGGSYAARGRKPAAERTRPTRRDPAPLQRTGERISVDIALEWLDAGRVELDTRGKPRFPTLPATPGIYRLTLSGRPDQDRPLLYIGESDNLRRRAGNYRNPGPRQRTSLRVNAVLREHLAAGGRVDLVIATAATIAEDGDTARVDLTRKAGRLLAESVVLVRAQQAGDHEIQNLG